MSGRVMRPCHFAICGDWRNDAMNSLGGPVVGIVTGDCYRVEDVSLDQSCCVLTLSGNMVKLNNKQESVGVPHIGRLLLRRRCDLCLL